MKGKGFIRTSILIAIIVGLFVVGGISYFGIVKYKNYQIEKSEKEKLAQDVEKIRQEKEDEEKKKQESELEALKEEVEALKNQKPQIIIKEVPIEDENDLPSIINQWRPKIAHISCEWRYSDTNKAYLWASGSGVLMKDSNGIITGKAGSIIILTNRHVLQKDDKYTPDNCDISLPGMVSSLKIIDEGPLYFFRTSHFGFDWGVIVLHYPTEYIKNLSSNDISICKNKSAVGDKVVILGYPVIGSQTDITATEGIVSGYDGNYYITSAKIEQGNSGGAAISLKNNCYLGIPSFAQVGVIESLARILDIEVVYRSSI